MGYFYLGGYTTWVVETKEKNLFSRMRGGEAMADRKAVKELKKDEKYNQIRIDLFNQLKINKTKGKYYDDLVDDYMSLWVTKNLLISDINSRGVSIKYNNGGGQSGRKKNDSVSELVKVNTQMLKLLNELGLKPTDFNSDGDEDGEL